MHYALGTISQYKTFFNGKMKLKATSKNLAKLHITSKSRVLQPHSSIQRSFFSPITNPKIRSTNYIIKDGWFFRFHRSKDMNVTKVPKIWALWRFHWNLSFPLSFSPYMTFSSPSIALLFQILLRFGLGFRFGFFNLLNNQIVIIYINN